MKYILVFVADWANGLLAVVGASFITGTEVIWWHFLVGIVLAHSPDIDALGELYKRGKVSASSNHIDDHRNGLHYPILWIAVGILISLSIGYWGIIFLIATTLHFINDLYGTGWGIKLLWPLSSRNYKFLGRRVNRLKSILLNSDDWSKLPEKERKLRLVVSWSKEELPIYIKKWGIDNWITYYYLKPNFINLTEYLIFILAVSLVLFF